MMSEQNRQTQKVIEDRIKKHRTLIIFIACFFSGMAGEIRAWRKHDIRDAVVVAIIFLVLAPLLVIGFRKLIGSQDD
jgi:hypothetical protein